MSTPLIKEFHYDVPIEKVWQALTEKSKMKIWYFPQIQEFKPVVGFEFQFNDDHSQYQKKWTVTRVIENETLAHNWSYKGYKGNSEVSFDLKPERLGTILKVTQTDLDSFPKDSHFGRERFEWGWNNLLGQNLRHLLEDN